MTLARFLVIWTLVLTSGQNASVAAVPVNVDGLLRTAHLGIGWGRTDRQELLVQRVEPRSPAAQAGLREGDVILRIDRHELRPHEFALSSIYGVRGGVPVTFTVRRGLDERAIRFVPEPAPLERSPGIETHYGMLQGRDGTRLRTIVTRPTGSARLPAILLVQWSSCDTIDGPLADDDGWKLVIEGLVRRSGMIVWRTDKAGVGDSEGDCSTYDWDSEVADHRAALEALARRPDVLPGGIFVVGMSIGARMAPLVARGRDVAGIATWGGGSVSWFEYVMNHHRYFALRDGVPPEQLSQRLLQQASVLIRLFDDGATLQSLRPTERQVWREMPRVNPVSELLYNRALAWHRQAARSNWPAAWLETRVPVLIIYGAFDNYDTLASVNWTGQMINARTPGRARIAIIPDYNHHFQRFTTIEDAEANWAGRADAEPFLAVVLPWLQATAQQARAGYLAGR